MGLQEKIATGSRALIGSVTFFGSYVAFGKLAEFLAVKWKLKGWQTAVKYGFAAATGVGGLAYALTVHALRGGEPERPADRLGSPRHLRLHRLAADAQEGPFPRHERPASGPSPRSAIGVGAWLVVDPSNIPLYWLLTGVSAVLGVLLTISIGGADMPVAIALLNSYSGLGGAARPVSSSATRC